MGWSNSGWRSDQGGWYKNAGGVIPLTIDGTPAGANTAGATTVSCTLTTTLPNNRIIVFILNNASVDLTSVTDTAGLTYTKRASSLISGNTHIEEWSAVSPSASPAGNTITATAAGAVFMTIAAFAVNGGTGSFDPVAASISQTGDVSITTTNANTILFAGYRFSGTPSPAEGSGWTKIWGSNYTLVEYKIVSATQSGTVATVTTGAADQNGGIGDAIF